MPIEVIDSRDPFAGMISFRTSAIFEMIMNLALLYAKPERAVQMPDEAFMIRLRAFYSAHYGAHIFVELGIDYPDQDDVPGFLAYLRAMPPEQFLFYALGRLFSVEQLAATGFDPAKIEALLGAYRDAELIFPSPPYDWVADLATLRDELADLWETYWRDHFSAQLPALFPQWQRGIAEKDAILKRDGGLKLYEHMTGRSTLPDPIPADQPITQIECIPIYQMPGAVFLLYGFGRLTILFDSERTEARLAELERTRDQALSIARALADESRLKLLRMIARSSGECSGKWLAEKLEMNPSSVSRHLSQLKESGLVIEKPLKGNHFSYRFNQEALDGLPGQLLEYFYS